MSELAERVGAWFITRWIRACAEGNHGPRLQGAYWWLAGKKTWTAFVMVIGGVGVAAAGYPAEAAWACVLISGPLLSAGLLDRAWRSQGVPDALAQSAPFRFLAAHSGVLTGLCALILGWTTTYHPDPAAIGTEVVVGAVLAHVGLIDAAWRTAPPVIDFGDMGQIDPADIEAVREALRKRGRA